MVALILNPRGATIQTKNRR